MTRLIASLSRQRPSIGRCIKISSSTATGPPIANWCSAGSVRGQFGPQFADRDPAIDWLAAWLDGDGEAEHLHSVA